MAETVTVIPSGGFDNYGDPIIDGDPVTLTTRGVAPGNTSYAATDDGGSDTVEFTVYLNLADGPLISDDDFIVVRGKKCRARVRTWVSPWSSFGGIEVLCKSVTGKG